MNTTSDVLKIWLVCTRYFSMLTLNKIWIQHYRKTNNSEGVLWPTQELLVTESSKIHDMYKEPWVKITKKLFDWIWLKPIYSLIYEKYSSIWLHSVTRLKAFTHAFQFLQPLASLSYQTCTVLWTYGTGLTALCQ